MYVCADPAWECGGSRGNQIAARWGKGCPRRAGLPKFGNPGSAILGPCGAILGPTWRHVGPCWAIAFFVRRHRSKAFGSPFRSMTSIVLTLFGGLEIADLPVARIHHTALPRASRSVQSCSDAHFVPKSFFVRRHRTKSHSDIVLLPSCGLHGATQDRLGALLRPCRKWHLIEKNPINRHLFHSII